MKKLVVLISGRGSNMVALADACAEGQVPAKLVGVISDNAEAAGLDKARARGIPATVVDYKAYPTNDLFVLALLAACQARHPDLIALSGFMRVLSGAFVRPLKGRVINIHPSLLPKYAGLNTHKRVLDAGEKQHGCSVHYVTETVDAGPLIAQDVFAVREDDTVETLALRGIAREHLLYPYVVKLICEQRLTMKDNAVLLDGRKLSEPLSLPSP